MASKMTTEHIRRLKEELHRVQMEIRTLQGKEEALRLAVSVVSDEPISSEPRNMRTSDDRKRRSPIKDLVLRFALERAEQGVVATDIVDLARAEHVILDRNSVSSLLSKFKKEGVLDHDGKVYRPAKSPRRDDKNAA